MGLGQNIPKFDEKDYLILKILTSDGMARFKDISKQVGLSPPSVSARIRKLRKMGVFDPGIYIDYQKVGLRRYTLGLTLRTGTPPDSRAKIIERLIDEDKVVSIWSTSGDHDLVVHVVFSSSDELTDFIDEKVRPLREIETIDIIEVLATVKREGKKIRSGITKDIPFRISSR